jgi:hypothetical protein
MAKSKPNPLWKGRVLEWQKSGKNARSWCNENKIPYTTFCGWRSRLKRLEGEKALTPEIKSAFIELKEQSDLDPGIILEYRGVKIQLRADFSTVMLKRCLDCLGDLPC